MFKNIRAHAINKAPALLKISLQATPFVVKQKVIENLINWQFHHALLDGELDFLEGRVLKIEIRDLEQSWFITLQKGKLCVSKFAEPDVIFSANTNDLILVAARKEDPDTLFFQRRLQIEGDTELGLHIKNLMDSIDIDSMPLPLRVGLTNLANLIEITLNEGAGYQNRASLHVN